MPKNYRMTRRQRAEAATMLKSERREFENSLRNARTSAQASRIRGGAYSTNRGTASAGSAAG